jgi:hypothetical protein
LPCLLWERVKGWWPQASDAGSVLVAIHDSARPLVRQEDVRRCFADALEVRQLRLDPHTLKAHMHVMGQLQIHQEPRVREGRPSGVISCAWRSAGGGCSAGSACEAHHQGGGWGQERGEDSRTRNSVGGADAPGERRQGSQTLCSKPPVIVAMHMQNVLNALHAHPRP